MTRTYNTNYNCQFLDWKQGCQRMLNQKFGQYDVSEVSNFHEN